MSWSTSLILEWTTRPLTTIERVPSVSRRSCRELRWRGKRADADFLDQHRLEHHDLAEELTEDRDALLVPLFRRHWRRIYHLAGGS